MASASASNGSYNDLQSLTSRAWKIYKSLSRAPEELRDVQEGALSVVGALRLVYEHSQEHQLSTSDARTLQDHLTRCNTVIFGVEASLSDLKQQSGSVEEIARSARKLEIQAARISSFHEILRRNLQERILQSLEHVREAAPDTFQGFISRDWSFVLNELQKHGLSRETIEDEYFFIDRWLKNNGSEDGSIDLENILLLRPDGADQIASSSASFVSNGLPARDCARLSSQEARPSSYASRIALLPAELVTDEELPSYAPSKDPTNIVEKNRQLEQTTAILNAEASISNMASSSQAAPPAYTFEEGSDQEMDEEFSRYIQQAIAMELKRRYQEREAHPNRGPFPYSWLPKLLQQQYAGRDEVQTMLDAKSFSVMSYQTAPHCLAESEGLIPVLQMSSDGAGDDTVYLEGSKTLKTMVQALSKFVVVQDPRPGDEHFSDLDALEYEYDTARAVDQRMQSGVDHRIQFPDKPFELAQKSYYNLLTYVMGMLGLLKDIFPGRTYVTRTREELKHLWKDRRMSARTVWIQKQVASWSQVDEAVAACRNWHRLRPIRDQAITAIQAWRQSVTFLHASDSIINLTILSANNLPKTRNLQIKVILYASNNQRPVWTWRAFVGETAQVKKGRFPSFNAHFKIKCPEFPKTLDMNVLDVGIIGKELGRVRMKFNHIPGVEKNLEGRSLLYDFDEELSLPLPLTESAKGKEKEIEPATLSICLSWKGRLRELEESGLPMKAPGKMFKQDIAGLPLPFEDKLDTSSLDAPNSSHAGSLGAVMG